MEHRIQTAYVREIKRKQGTAWQGVLEYVTPESDKYRRMTTVFDREKVKTKAQAERHLKRWRDEATAKLASMKEPKPLPVDATMSVYEYVKQTTRRRIASRKLEESTQYSYRFSLAHVEEAFSKIRLCDLKPTTVSAWIAGMNEKGLSPATISKAFRLLKQACDIAVDEELIPRNPCKRKAVMLPEARKEEPNVLDDGRHDELVKLLSGMERTPTVLAAYIALYAGMRRGEICALTWGDIDLDAATISVNKTIGIKQGGTYIKQPKSASGKLEVPISTQLAPVLAAHRAFMHEDWAALLEAAGMKADDAAFSKLYVIGTLDGRYANPTRLGKTWQALAESHNLMGTQGRYITLHDLRHQHATTSIAEGADVKSVSDNLGHANTSITLDIYAAADKKAKRRAVEKVGDVFDPSTVQGDGDGDER